MPCTIIPNTTSSTLNPWQPSTKNPTATFTGSVYMDTIHQDSASYSGVSTNINHVTFLPGARTFWHTHEHGQILEVKAGSGWVCDFGGTPRRIRTGDLVVCPAGTRHWHGADKGSMMMHLAISLGKTSWEGEVDESEVYQKKEQQEEEEKKEENTTS